MERVNAICRHPLWQDSMRRIAALERDRIFCRHDISHLLDVARLAYIENLERGLGIAKVQIYAAALLHDLGRGLQYEQGVPHDQGSARLAEVILRDCGFSADECGEICSAISRHRTSETGTRQDLAGLLYRADKASRPCLFCEAEQACNWTMDKKNLTITT